MKKALKKILASIICAVMIVTAIPLGGLVGVDWGELFSIKSEAASYAVGQIIEFGSYPQSQVTDPYLSARLAEKSYSSDGKIVYEGNTYYRLSSTQFFYNEPIKWRVLSADGKGILVVAEEALDCEPYHTSPTFITWADCTLRAWLNTEFYNKAFTSTEMQKIITTHLENGDNPDYGTSGGNDTNDKVFVLSLADVLDESYGFENLSFSQTRKAYLSGYAHARAAIRNNDGTCDWWLRTPGNSGSSCYVSGGHAFSNLDTAVYSKRVTVRPALKLNLSSGIFDSKNNSQYSLRITDSETNKPISGASVDFNGKCYTTASDGMVTISVGSNVAATATVAISKTNMLQKPEDYMN